MIHPTRTVLLQLREKHRSVEGSVKILQARRQALIREFLLSSRPFLQSRDKIKRDYRRALDELHLSLGHEGESAIASIAALSPRDLGLNISEQNVLGVLYREVRVGAAVLRSPEDWPYDYRATTPHLEEAIALFERILAAMLEIAAYESKLKRLGEEIARVTRRTRVLEERVIPKLKRQIRSIAQHIREREREAYFRLKRFKERRLAPSPPPRASAPSSAAPSAPHCADP